MGHRAWGMGHGARCMGHTLQSMGNMHNFPFVVLPRLFCFVSFLFVLPFLRSICGVDGDASEMLPPFPPCKQKE